jgi:tRNA(Ile2) C34 agmatinyltransferase TiaS
VMALPNAFRRETAACPVCGKDAHALGRRAMQIVFRCQGCKVTFKRAHNLSFDF